MNESRPEDQAPQEHQVPPVEPVLNPGAPAPEQSELPPAPMESFSTDPTPEPPVQQQVASPTYPAPQQHAAPHQPAPTPQAAAPAPSAGHAPTSNDGSQTKLSTFMKVSIGILTAVTLASIALLFIGDFEGKFERVFSTIALFAIFVLLTGFDTRRERKNEWYAPVALIANAYILGLLLIVIWVTPYDPFGLQWSILWKSVFVIVTTRLVTFGMELLLKIGEERPAPLGRWGQITSILGVLALILFTAPVGIEAFRVTVPDLYWKFAVATLILTALGLAITLLLRWYYRSGEKAAQRPVQPQQPAPVQPGPAVAPQQAAVPQPAATQPVAPQQTVQPQAPAPAQPPVASPASESAPSQLLPWPTFADGTPLPAGPDGQPDFSVLQQPPYAGQ